MASRHVLATLGRNLASTSSAVPNTSFARRCMSTSVVRHAISNFTMPAMSPTMTSGGVATWKVKEGESFSAGDVLLEIETDKATMDVEAQDDGIMAKIVVQEGAKDVQVGKVIAVLAEEGDDISNVEVPKEDEQASQPQQQQQQEKDAETSSGPTSSQQFGQEAKSSPHPSTQTGASTGGAAPGSSSSTSHHQSKGPMFPSVQRLIAENNIQDAESKIKGTGIRGMITKGDVLAFLGRAKSPTGTFKEAKGGIAVLGPSQAFPKKASGANAASSGDAKKVSEPLTGTELRSLIIGGLAASAAARKTRPAPTPAPAPEPAPVAPKKVVTRKDGIRSDDPLWSLF
ncbi:uncharacterized protein PFL1_00647 [Pseudozyma flocculosa PF-1]|uniref:Related to pyruvate dehydrogenase complex protein X, dihydrolipoamide acetyltransferase component n=1 Tax=Pseudozyma flocculosa TaxID=84751 RepID=A0A5C3ER14_9BASI|nr:uncharacterized protein PFL1_00647 [Pseudozyma flocculosa PF-1]EPQ32451.1 hypothetical protein PFL1_00647 [Pseudozyma flocculosa PF-1]SPO34562.1 related to pyruvate dehydrogenase complex protein X precursor, dihydrolipoamide acetyltransferase component [Pseudozyma flocculosa]